MKVSVSRASVQTTAASGFVELLAPPFFAEIGLAKPVTTNDCPRPGSAENSPHWIGQTPWHSARQPSFSPHSSAHCCSHPLSQSHDPLQKFRHRPKQPRFPSQNSEQV